MRILICLILFLGTCSFSFAETPPPIIDVHMHASALADFEKLKCLWYGKRTLTLFTSLILPLVSAKKRADAAQFLSPFSRFRIKTLDLQQFLQEQPWHEYASTR